MPIARGETLPKGDGSEPAILVHSAWPANDPSLWDAFRQWSLSLRASAAERDAWFVGIGSGLEAHSAHPELKDPYKSYALRKHELRDALVASDAGRFTWIRLHFMFGPGERPSRWVTAAINASLTGESFVTGSLDRRRRWLHVDDQADYFAAFLEAPDPGIFDIAGRGNVSFRDLLTLIERATGRDLKLEESDVLGPDSAISLIEPERMASVVPADAGSLEALSDRLGEYAGQLKSSIDTQLTQI